MDITIDTAPLKEIQKFIWSQGDFSKVAADSMPAAEALVAAAQVRPGDHVLDVGAGTGNAALAAARLGAAVTATDLTPSMVEQGRRRTDSEGVAVEWLEADAEALPFPDGAFDRVVSCFGAMFAPRPAVTVAELFRVVRPGGTVAMANWCPGSLPGRQIETISSFMPPRPDGVPSPLDWGVEEVARERVGVCASGVRTERGVMVTERESIEALLAFEAAHLGPLVAASMVLGDRFDELEARLRDVFAELDRGEGDRVRIESDYLIVVASA